MLAVDVFGEVVLRVKHIAPNEHNVMVLRDDLVAIELHVIDADPELLRVLARADIDVIRHIARFVHDGECGAGHGEQMALEFLSYRVRGLDRIRSNDDVGDRLAIGDEIDRMDWKRRKNADRRQQESAKSSR